MPDLKIAISMNTRYPEYGRNVCDSKDTQAINDLSEFHFERDDAMKFAMIYGKKEHYEVQVALKKQTKKSDFNQLLAERLDSQKF